MRVRGSWLGVSPSRRINALTGTIAILAVGVGLALAAVGASAASAEITEYEYPQVPFGPASEGQIAAGPEGDLWFAGVAGPVMWGGVGRFSPPSDWEDIGAEPPGTGNNAFVGNGTNGIAVGPDGNLWFTAGHGIGRIKPSGTPEAEDFFLPSVEAASLGGITAGPEHENLWFTDVEAPNTNKIGSINATSHLITEFPLPAGNELGAGVGALGNDDIAVGHEGNLWFTEPASHAIGVINTKGEFQHQFSVATSPLGIAAGPDGDMWFTDGTTPDVIGRITPSGEVTEFPSPGPSASIVEGPDGNMWFTTGGHGTGEAGLGCITPTGQTALHPDPTPSGLPWGIAVNKDGSIWFTELSANRLGRLYPVVCGATPVVAPVVGPVIVVPVAPILSSLSETAKTWRAGNALAQISKKSKKKKLPLGTTFSFSLNEPASVTFTFTERTSGRKVKGKCVAQTKKNKKKPHCTRTVTAGTLTFSAHAGTNKVRFEGPITTHEKLKPGSYTLLVTATASGKHSTTETLHFTIA
jgi:virginiamycin B lyase